MKDSAIYRRAAEMMAAGDWPCGCCLAITEARMEAGLPEDDDYRTTHHLMAESYFGWKSGNFFGRYRVPEHTEHRILSMCLMSAIAASEEAERD